MGKIEKIPYLGIPAKCFVCEDGGDVRAVPDTENIKLSVDDSDISKMNVSMPMKLICIKCGETEKIGFEYITLNITV